MPKVAESNISMVVTCLGKYYPLHPSVLHTNLKISNHEWLRGIWAPIDLVHAIIPRKQKEASK
jgi:hypothetical protein